MIRSLMFLLLLISTFTVNGQKLMIEKGTVIFFSEAPLENITAKNAKASGLLNTATMEFAFSVPIKEFKFEKSLMQEHFNEKYMESERFPKSTFVGKVAGLDLNSTAEQQVTATGKLTIHGVTRDVVIPATLRKSGNSYNIKAKFPVKLVDHEVKVPELMWQKIAEQVDVTVEFTMRPQ